MAANSRTSKNRVILMAVMLVLTSCGFLGGAVFWAGNSLESRAKSLPYHLDEARRLGLLTSISELQRDAEPAKDALPDLKAAFFVWDGLGQERQTRLLQLGRRGLRGRFAEAERERFTAELRQSPGLMTHLIAAASKPDCSVREVETWRNRRLARFWTFVREGVRLIGAHAVMAGQERDVARAEHWLSLGVQLSKHLGAQPSFAATLRKCASEAELQRAAERVCFANRDDTARLSGLLATLQYQMGPTTAASDAMRGEPPLFLLALSDPKKNGLEHVPAGGFFADVGKAGALEIFNRYYRKLPSDPEDLQSAERVLIGMDTEATETSLYGNYVKGYDAMMPLLRDMVVRRRLAQAAIDYFENGHIEAMPIDPYTEMPLRLADKGAFMVLYSVGRDGQDDGGKEREVGPQAALNYDILFRLPKPL